MADIGDTVVPDGRITFEPAPIDQGTVLPPIPQSQTTNTEDSGQYLERETPAQQQQRINTAPLSPLVNVNLYDNTVTPVILGDEITSIAPRQNPIANPLLDFDSYTYSLSLHGISITEYNNLVGNPDGYVPKQVLIAGGGRYGDTFPRNTYFQNTDFFFDDFRMTSVVNTTTRNKWSNLIECKFTIIEPLGFTLIKRLMLACMSPDGGIRSPNYLKQPFILQIDFFGHKDGNLQDPSINSSSDAYGEGSQLLASHLSDNTKYIPIRLVDMKSKVTSKGTEYQFSAVPFNHTAFSPTKIVTPADFSVKAKTVKDIFGKGFDIPPDLLNAVRDQQRFETGGFNTNTGDASVAEYYANKPAVTSKAFPAAGLCDKINAWYIGLQQKNGSIPDKFSVEFDEVIGNSPIESGGQADTSTVAESGNSKTATQQAAGASKSTIDFHNQTINIPAGTSIGAVIEWAIVNSEWFQTANIFNDAEAKSSKNKQADQRTAILNAFKIIPRIKVTEYDPGRADYSYEIVFQVKRWLANSKATNAAQGRTPGWLKEYNYLYSGGARSLNTGKFTDNRDVIDLQIDFNMLYYTQVTAFKNKEQLAQTGAGLSTGQPGAGAPLAVELTSAQTGKGDVAIPTTRERPQSSDGQDGPGSTYDQLAPPSTVYISKNTRTNVSKGSNVGARVAAAEILNTQLVDLASGDMINVKLKIIGDPTFIKQDDLFYNSGLGYSTSLLTKNNSIRTDDSELYVFLTFRTPDDYDESTGLAIPGQNKFSYTEFTGVYKIITIDSQFTKGKFEQTLDLVKLLTSDAKLNVPRFNTDRIDGLQILGVGQTNRFPSTLPFGPRIVQTAFSGGSVSGLVQGLVNQGINTVTNKIITEISTEVNSVLADIGSSLSSTLEGFALDAQEFLGIGTFSDLGDVTADAFSSLSGAGELSVLDNVNFDLPSFNWSGVSDNFWV